MSRIDTLFVLCVNSWHVFARPFGCKRYYGGEYDVQDTPGTTHISVVGPDGDAVSVTSTINLNFGAKLMTEDGIILNNQVSH